MSNWKDKAKRRSQCVAKNGAAQAPAGPGIPHNPAEAVRSSVSITPVIVSLADVQPESVEWLWSGRIAIGKLTLLAGDPGLGKSFITIDIAARVSTGLPWPDAPGIPQPAGGVVLLSAEDGIADTIRPRLDAGGADVTRIKAIQAVRRTCSDGENREATFSLETDLPALEQAIQSMPGCRLIIIDPITAYLGGTDSHKNADIRGLLAPLAALAAKYRVAIVLVTHLNKSGNGPAVYRSIGSIAFAAAARAVWAVTKDQSNPDRRLMLPAKNNLAKDTQGLAYSIVCSGIGGAAVVAWEPDPVNLSADDAMNADDGKAEKRDDDQAQAWLRDALKDGPVPSDDVLAQGRSNGFTNGALRRALKELGSKPGKVGFKGGWMWKLPDKQDSVSREGESSASSQSSQKHGESSIGDNGANTQNSTVFREGAEDAEVSPDRERASPSVDDDTEWGEVA